MVLAAPRRHSYIERAAWLTQSTQAPVDSLFPSFTLLLQHIFILLLLITTPTLQLVLVTPPWSTHPAVYMVPLSRLSGNGPISSRGVPL